MRMKKRASRLLRHVVINMEMFIVRNVFDTDVPIPVLICVCANMPLVIVRMSKNRLAKRFRTPLHGRRTLLG